MNEESFLKKLTTKRKVTVDNDGKINITKKKKQNNKNGNAKFKSDDVQEKKKRLDKASPYSNIKKGKDFIGKSAKFFTKDGPPAGNSFKGKKNPNKFSNSENSVHSSSNNNNTMTKEEQKLAKKETKMKRQNSRKKNNYDLIMKTKYIFETLRRADCPKPEKDKLCKELHSLVKGKVNELIFQHDTSRVIGCLMTHGSDDIRNEIFEEMTDRIVDMAMSKYGKFLVLKVLKNGTRKQKEVIYKAFDRKIIKLIRHTEAAVVLECVYNECANSNLRASMTHEFYGPEFSLFKDSDTKSLSEVLEKLPNKKEEILAHIKENVTPVLEKSCIKYSIVHHILWEYLSVCNEKDKAEMIENIRESLVEILHTNEGAKVAMFCVWHGTTKDRKQIIKSMKSHVLKICKEENGHKVLLSIFDCVDDTKLVQKVILNEIEQSLKEIVLDPNGRKVIFYLVSPRNSVYFHPDVAAILKMGDDNAISKKDKNTRSMELLSYISKSLLQLIAQDAKELCLNSSASVVVEAILKNCSGDPTEAYTKIAEVAGEPFVAGSAELTHIIESPAGHLLMTHLIQLDKIRSTVENLVLFCPILLDTIPKESFRKWINCNRGAFKLITMIETEIPEIMEKVKNIVNPLKPILKEKKFAGAKILLSKLD